MPWECVFSRPTPSWESACAGSRRAANPLRVGSKTGVFRYCRARGARVRSNPMAEHLFELCVAREETCSVAIEARLDDAMPAELLCERPGAALCCVGAVQTMEERGA